MPCERGRQLPKLLREVTFHDGMEFTWLVVAPFSTPDPTGGGTQNMSAPRPATVSLPVQRCGDLSTMGVPAVPRPAGEQKCTEANRVQ